MSGFPRRSQNKENPILPVSKMKYNYCKACGKSNGSDCQHCDKCISLMKLEFPEFFK